MSLNTFCTLDAHSVIDASMIAEANTNRQVAHPVPCFSFANDLTILRPIYTTAQDSHPVPLEMPGTKEDRRSAKVHPVIAANMPATMVAPEI